MSAIRTSTAVPIIAWVRLGFLFSNGANLLDITKKKTLSFAFADADAYVYVHTCMITYTRAKQRAELFRGEMAQRGPSKFEALVGVPLDGEIFGRRVFIFSPNLNGLIPVGCYQPTFTFIEGHGQRGIFTLNRAGDHFV